MGNTNMRKRENFTLNYSFRIVSWGMPPQARLRVKCAVICVQAAAEPVCADLPESPDSGPPAQESA